MNGNARLAALFFGTSFVLALGMSGADMGQTPWFVSRASGLVAYVLLSASVVFGLLMSTKAGDGILPRPAVFEIHQFTSVLTLSLLGLHGGSLMFDSFLHFTPASILIPFVGPYRPLWVGLGVLGAWSTAIVTGSFWARKRIGQKNWRRLHFLSFAAWLLSVIHGFTAGTDSALAPVFWMYVLTAAAVAALLTYRIGAALAPAPTPVQARQRASAPRQINLLTERDESSSSHR
jgi:methionine sulfoxide reductase heme-binding subunit